MGKYNEDDSDASFIIGNGTGVNNRKNALTVNKNTGLVTVNDIAITNPGSNENSLLTKGTADTLYLSKDTTDLPYLNQTTADTLYLPKSYDKAIVVGQQYNSILTGDVTGSISSGYWSATFGNKNKNYASRSLVAGYDCVAGQEAYPNEQGTTLSKGVGAIAIGWGAKCPYGASQAIGTGVEVGNTIQTVLGCYNTVDTNGKVALIVGNGNGSGTKTSNAIIVYKSDQTKAVEIGHSNKTKLNVTSTDVTIDNQTTTLTDNSVATKKYVDTLLPLNKGQGNNAFQ